MSFASHASSLAPGTLAWMQRLAEPRLVEDFYLAGAAATALYCGHRLAFDLDWMSPAQRLKSPQRRDLLEALLEVDSALKVETARDGYLFARAGDGTGLRFFYYPYPLLEPLREIAGCEVASHLDLVLMKLAAIISRGARRDFVDLYLLLADGEAATAPSATGLEDALERSVSKFGHVLDFPLQALKGLADRSRAEGEPMPGLATTVDWAEIEAWLDGPVRDLALRQVGLAGAPDPATPPPSRP